MSSAWLLGIEIGVREEGKKSDDREWWLGC
jgi:hypothetical protein